MPASSRLDFYDDPAAFLRDAEAVLAADPVVGTVVASVTQRLVEEAADGLAFDAPYAPWWLLVRDGPGAPVGAAMRTAPFAPYPLFLLPMPDDAARALASAVHARGERVGGLNGARPAVDLAAATWTRLTGEPMRIVEHTRLFELGDLVAPPAPPGRLRSAEARDLRLALDWFERFFAEADEQAGRAPGDRPLETAAGTEEEMLRRFDQGRVWLWEDPQGTVVHLCGANLPAYGVCRIGPVFTPREHRGRGYASAAVAEVSRLLRDRGSRVCLFTDQANPTSNGVYQRIGYRPVVDMAMLLAGEPGVS